MVSTKSTSRAKVSSISAARSQVVRLLTVLALIVFVVSAWAWWHYVRSAPKRVFAGMLANNLKTTGVTDHLKQSNGSQNLDQTIQLITSPTQRVNARTVLSQENGGQSSRIVTETVGTPFEDYVRYVDLVVSQKNSQGKDFDFSSVKNVWGKTGSSKDEMNAQAAGELYNQSVLTVVPTANLPVQARQALLEQIKARNVYEVDYDNVERRINNGRPEYTYKVKIKPDAYVGMLKQFARYIGMTQLENIDAANYKDAPPIEVQISVDVWTRQLRSIDYAEGERAENFSSYGAQRITPLPKETITIEELQKRVQSLQ